MTRLQEHLRRWSTNQPLSLEDLITAEQFYQILPEGMVVWVKDRKPGNLERMAELADDYMLSRRGVGQVADSSSGRSDGNFGGRNSGGSAGSAHGRNGGRSNSGFGGSVSTQSGNGVGNGYGAGRQVTTNIKVDKRCFQCGKFGHLMYCNAMNGPLP